MDKKACSEKMGVYFAEIDAGLAEAYEIVKRARARGFDPEDTPPIQLASDMAERVAGLISVLYPQIIDSPLSTRIKELEAIYGSLDWRVGICISLELAQGKICKFKDKIDSMEAGIRVGLAYITMGTVSSPIEGFLGLKVRKTAKGTEYLAACFGGPIRSAGATMAAVSVVMTDYVRMNMGYDVYDPTEEEVKRSCSELYDYHERISNLQYLPSEEEIDYIVRHLPIQIDGDPSEKIEVSNHKNLPRIETPMIRNGHCLVVGEGVCQKAPKVWKQIGKWGKDFGLEGWSFLGEFVELQKKIKAHAKKDSGGGEKPKVMPDYTFIKDLVAGRPVFTHPMRVGGFRLRYGRCRTSGFSSYPIHPATMQIVNEYLAIGTQMKMERPGKATSLTSCDSIEGPIVKLSGGDVIQLKTLDEAKKYDKDIVEIIFLGDILVNYGDFSNRNHILVPPGYCVEWYGLDLEKAIVESFGVLDVEKLHSLCSVESERICEFLKDPFSLNFTAREAIAISKALGVPLFPYYGYHYRSQSPQDILDMIAWLKRGRLIEGESGIERLVAPLDPRGKRVAEVCGIPHSVSDGFVIFDSDAANSLSVSLDLPNRTLEQCQDLFADAKDGLDAVSRIAQVKIRDRSGLFIGARMGRPEKAKERELTGSPHGLFPIGEEGGRMRCFQSALEAGKITSDFPLLFCEKCQKETIFRVCEVCEGRTKQLYNCRFCGRLPSNMCPQHGPANTFSRREIDIKHYFSNALARLKMNVYPDLIKGIRGTSNKIHITERIEKGILRAKHGVHVNKDGTTRYDMTQLPITHFKPKEVVTSVTKLRSLGYDVDIHGAPLVDPDQVLELKPQDIILPTLDPPFEGVDKVFGRVANFIDDMLVNLYGVEPFYNVKTGDDLVGHLVLCLAPHTAAGITARIIGYSRAQGFFAHPYIHAATRRDCDGDEACVTLVLDALLNFSRFYLPATRGSTQDAPLVLTSRIVPAEVDDGVFDFDTVWKYPLEFYAAANEYKNPTEIKLEQLKDRFGLPSQYEGIGYTHPTSDLNCAVPTSAYKTLPSMLEKLEGQMEIAQKIRAVDTEDVARLIIEKHFIKDTRGNLRKFSMQQFRCVGCNEKFRRPPLIGRCTKCKGKLIFTISEGSIVKYLKPSIDLAKKYALSPYLRQTIDVLQRKVEGIFGREKERQAGLAAFLGDKGAVDIPILPPMDDEEADEELLAE